MHFIRPRTRFTSPPTVISRGKVSDGLRCRLSTKVGSWGVFAGRCLTTPRFSCWTTSATQNILHGFCLTTSPCCPLNPSDYKVRRLAEKIDKSRRLCMFDPTCLEPPESRPHSLGFGYPYMVTVERMRMFRDCARTGAHRAKMLNGSPMGGHGNALQRRCSCRRPSVTSSSADRQGIRPHHEHEDR